MLFGLVKIASKSGRNDNSLLAMLSIAVCSSTFLQNLKCFAGSHSFSFNSSSDLGQLVGDENTLSPKFSREFFLLSFA